MTYFSPIRRSFASTLAKGNEFSDEVQFTAVVVMRCGKSLVGHLPPFSLSSILRVEGAW